jgi:hypothetical protein
LGSDWQCCCNDWRLGDFQRLLSNGQTARDCCRRPDADDSHAPERFAELARASGVSGRFVERKCQPIILAGPGHTCPQPDLLRRPAAAFLRKGKAVPAVRPGR